MSKRRDDDWQEWDDREPTVNERFEVVRPEGYKRMWRQVKVAGTSAYHASAARTFALGSDRRVRLVAEPSNPRDPNAIAVVGECAGLVRRRRDLMLGYLPRELAADIADLRLPVHRIAAHLVSIWMMERDRDFFSIRLSLSCPREWDLKTPMPAADAEASPGPPVAAPWEQEPASLAGGCARVVAEAADAAIARAKAAQEARDRRADFIASIPKRLAAAWRSLGRTGQLIAGLTLILATAAAAGVWAILRATS